MESDRIDAVAGPPGPDTASIASEGVADVTMDADEGEASNVAAIIAAFLRDSGVKIGEETTNVEAIRCSVRRKLSPAASPDTVITESNTAPATVDDSMNASDPDASLPPVELDQSEPLVAEFCIVTDAFLNRELL